MQPYQEATEEVRRQSELPLKLAKKAGSLAATAGSGFIGGGLLSRVLPLLSKYIPEEITVKGLSKIDPRFGKFFNKAVKAGKTIDEAKEVIKEKISPKEEKRQEALKGFNEKIKNSGLAQQETQRFQQQYGQQEQPQQQQSKAALQGSGDEALLAALDKILKM